MENQNNSSKVNCEYYVSMGKPGSLIIKAPVVLSNLKISIPITTELNFKESYINISENTNKISLSTLEITGNNELIINGSISKVLKYSISKINLNSAKSFNLDIPISEKININFDQIPINNNIDFKLYYQKNSQPIYCDLDYIQVLQDIITKKDNNYINEIIISLHLSLTQVQNVFIPEPDGNVLILNENSNGFILDKVDNDDPTYMIGFNPKKGLIAKSIKGHK
ncbi:hypothetical protein UT300003_34350 [Clostridium sardiniense]|uniref:hypothetical protein n=1 Tax=Clostridium sardiniense TaxID=29369 RepID=UPI00195BABA7|nr:hypothetical protein [Clostridium sardiniense]MBM7836593.1 hypothetical protein [Clostridium sardiniense]